jgi:hypothetical protein
VVLFRGPRGAVAPKREPVIVIVGDATPGPRAPLNDTAEMPRRDAAAGAALAASAGTAARARAAAAEVWLAGELMVVAGPFLCGRCWSGLSRWVVNA